MSVNKNYFNGLLKAKKSSKKQIAFYLDEDKIEQLDLLAKFFTSLGEAKNFSRNLLIETAIDKFLAESKEYLRNERGINLEELSPEDLKRAEPDEAAFDTAVFSTKEEGFRETFLGEAEPACWYPCRVSDNNIPHIKYIAIYREAPVSGITHYAKVKEIKYDEEKGCKVCYFDGDPVELPHTVTFRNTPTAYFHGGTKYTQLASLLDTPQADRSIFVRLT